jgi:hypothetical protein
MEFGKERQQRRTAEYTYNFRAENRKVKQVMRRKIHKQ